MDGEPSEILEAFWRDFSFPKATRADVGEQSVTLYNEDGSLHSMMTRSTWDRMLND